ncbi:MAG: DUF1573 domain-containing protein [Planctomycetes bacterium]|nr:DUF1573 domain-containing protein [Planctomycetota bacterium]
MMRFLLIAALLIAGCERAPQGPAPTPAPKPPQPKPVPTGKDPKVVFEMTTHDFGALTEGAERTTVFRFRNAGVSTLKIEQVRPTCGCTAILLTSDTIEPNAAGEIKVTFLSARFKGQVRKEIYVDTNDPYSSTVALTVMAQVDPIFVVEPETVVFGKVRIGHSVSREVIVRDRQGKPFTLLGVFCEEPAVTAVFAPVLESGGAAYRVTVSLAGNAPARAIVKPLTFHTDRPKDLADKTLWVSAEVTADVMLHPRLVYFGYVKRGETTSRTIEVSNIGDHRVEIERIEFQGASALLYEIKTLEEGRRFQVVLRVGKDQRPGRFSGTMLVHVSGQAAPLSLSYSGHVREN